MRPRSIVVSCAVAALTSLLAVPAIGSEPLPMLPLEIGNQWVYQDADANVQAETITGTRTVLGRTAYIKSYTLGPDAGLENWWLTGASGEVLLAGFDNPSAGLSLAYDPPITLVGANPSVGDSWLTHVVAYNVADMSVYAEFDIRFGAIEAVALTVPAGTFSSLGVGQMTAPTPAPNGTGAGFRLDGKRLAGTLRLSATGVSDWYSPGVGVVQYDVGSLWRLTGYGSVTPALGSSWGALKTRYRRD